MIKIFQKDLRNASSHQDYRYDQNEIHVEGITWDDDSRKAYT